ncbi:MAG: hypothetical protein H0X38_00590 [Planctomycetes bacterium]|nr:hypothetical protein [Planctomycetota bacterium]
MNTPFVESAAPLLTNQMASPAKDGLYLVMRSHLLLIASIAIVGLASGVGVALVKPRVYAFTTVLEIGRSDQPIESPASCIAKIKSAYAPIVQQKLREGSGGAQLIDIAITSPPNSVLVTLATRGVSADSARHIELLNEVASELLQDHRQQMVLTRGILDGERSLSELKLGEIKERKHWIANERKLLEDDRALVQAQFTAAAVRMTSSASNRETAGKMVNTQEQVLTLLMIDNQLVVESSRLDQLEERLRIGIPQEFQRLEREDADNVRNLSSQQEQIEQIKHRIANLRDTHLLASPRQSLEAVGVGRSLIALIGLCIGLVAGLGFALIVDRQRSPSMLS